MAQLNQAQKNRITQQALTPLPEPHLTGMKLQEDIILNDFVFNTVDEYGVLWVITDIKGWWSPPAPDMPEIKRGWADGSYDVKGRYNARDLTLEGSILCTDPSLAAERPFTSYEPSPQPRDSSGISGVGIVHQP